MDDGREKMRKWVLIIVMHLLAVLAWQAWITLGKVEPYIMPAPLETFATLLEFKEYQWIHNTLITSASVFGGFWMAVVVGVGLAVLFSWSRWLNDALMPLITTARGLGEVEPELIDLVRTLRASRWQIFTKILLPGALPYIFSGMKVAVVLAVAGAIVGEFIASEEGLGYLMMQVQVTLDTAGMFMAVLMITAVGVCLYSIVLLLERLLVVSDARME